MFTLPITFRTFNLPASLDAKQAHCVAFTNQDVHIDKSTPSLQFGFQRKFAALPDWTKDIKEPRYSMPDLWPLSDELSKNIGKLKRGQGNSATLSQMQRQTINIYRLYQKVQNELRYEGIPYLPEEKRKQVARFKRSFRYLVLRFFIPRSTQRQLVILQGPAAIKRAQEEYQLTEKLSNDMSTQIKNLKNLPGLSLGQRVKRFQILTLMRGLHLRMRWIISINKPLGNQVPGLPKEKLKEKLEAILNVYNKEFPRDQIRFNDIQSKPVASGSMGQVFLGKTRSGKRMIIKVQRETPKQMEGYLPYAYFCKTVMVGTQNLGLCVDEAKKQINTLKDEADARVEKRNAEIMESYVKRKGLKRVKVAVPLIATQGGLVMPFVGEKDLSNLNTGDRQEVIRHISPDLLNIQICSPYKLADLYFPNVRVPTPAYLIDHGRTFSLIPSTHKKLLKIVTLALASPEPQQQWGEDPQIQRAIKDLLGNGDTKTMAGKLALSLSLHMPDGAQKFMDMLMHPNPFFIETNTLGKGSKLFSNGNTLPGNEPRLNVLSFWSNYLILCRPEEGFPALMTTEKMLPAVLDLNSAHTKFKSTLGVGFVNGSDIDDDTLRRRVRRQATLDKPKISRQTLQQYRRLDGLRKASLELGKEMIKESGLSGQLTREQQENLKRRLNIAIYCDLLT